MQASTKILRLRTCPKLLNFSASKTYCEDSSSKGPKKENDNEIHKTEIDKETRRKQAKQKMTDLLQSLSKKPSAPIEESKIFQPVQKRKKAAPPKEQIPFKDYPIIDFSMREAVQKVAEDLGGDVKETESELLTSLRSHSGSKQNISDLLGSMTVDKSDDVAKEKSHSRMRRDQDQSGGWIPKSRLHEYRMDQDGGSAGFRQQKPINVFGAPPLGIFSPSFTPSEEARESLLPTWDDAYEREKKLCVSRQPKNYFEEMIKWTEQGKVWQFPIDNEIGLEEEKSFSFADHIFLERHLEGWCSSKGPIRHFMELVCVGLSKNPHLTVSRKIAHIEWYKNFFESKQDILRDVGAI